MIEEIEQTLNAQWDATQNDTTDHVNAADITWGTTRRETGEWLKASVDPSTNKYHICVTLQTHEPPKMISRKAIKGQATVNVDVYVRTDPDDDFAVVNALRTKFCLHIAQIINARINSIPTCQVVKAEDHAVMMEVDLNLRALLRLAVTTITEVT
jgi:hypothetical protein